MNREWAVRIVRECAERDWRNEERGSARGWRIRAAELGDSTTWRAFTYLGDAAAELVYQQRRVELAEEEV